MTKPRHVAVIDIGKTNAKLALVDLETLSEIAVTTRPNTILSGPPWPHFDTEGHWAFLMDALAKFHRAHGVDAISITTHGASLALLDRDEKLAAPILDYEHDGPTSVAQQYDAIRPPFTQTGSPRLAAGLNSGAQLHWQFLEDPDLHERTAHIITYPQYWAHRLCGVIACDATSIGCHTDLWAPYEGRFSDLIETLKIGDKIAPVRKSSTVLGALLPHVAAQTGLRLDTPVLCGIHDSNASLYPHILTQSGPFSVVSTGTWVVVMTMGGDDVVLDPARDTLVNVNALGGAVPSARFMGGREFEIIQDGHQAQATQADVAQLLAQNLMLLPAVEPSSGPFQGQKMQWSGGEEPPRGSGLRAAALSFYLALMTDQCLRLTGAAGHTIVEGPFAQNIEFLAMLSALTGRPVLQSSSATGTSIGAALLFGVSQAMAQPQDVRADQYDAAKLAGYGARWRQLTELNYHAL